MRLIKNIFITVRDAAYIRQTKYYSEEHAKKEYKFTNAVFWWLYYLTICIALGGVLAIFSPKSISFRNLDTFAILFLAVIMNIPYYLWLKWWLYPMLEEHPVDMLNEKTTMSYKYWTLALVYIVSIIFMFVVFIIGNLIRFGHV